jgi:hypothetical protein
VEDDRNPQQDPALVVGGLRSRYPEESEGEAGLPATAKQEDAVPGSGNRSGQMPGAALPVQVRSVDPGQ